MNRRNFSTFLLLGTSPLLALAKPGAAASAQPSALAKRWKAISRPGNALGGSITLAADGTLTLSPEGHEPATGTWKVPAGNTLVFSVPEAGGEARMTFKVTKTKLWLTYENGDVQEFSVEARPAATRK